MNPKHIEKITDQNRIAHAPYNFIELPEDIVNAQPLPQYNCYHQYTEHQFDENKIKIDRHTGSIECTLTTKSIFYTRCGLTPENFAKYSEPPKSTTKEEKERWEKEEKAKWEKERKEILAPFFSYLDNLPVIPGSSIRGMLRVLVEIVSFSKIDRVTDKKLFYRSIADRQNYTNHFIEEFELPHPNKPNKMIPCYHAKIHAGFLRTQGSLYIIEECGYGRINFDFNNPSVKSVITNLSHSHLYRNIGSKKVPNWQYQYKTIYVDIDINEKDHFFEEKFNTNGIKRHPDIYLRYRQVTSASWEEVPNFKKAKLVITGDMPHKHLEFVFLEDEILGRYPVDEDIISRFQDDDQVTKWQETAFPKDKPSPDCREQNGYLRDGEPVFFLLNNDRKTVRFLGRAQMFRLPYENSPLDFVPSQLRDTSCTDIAEAIFGYVNGEPPREKTCASRVFITDGIIKEKYKEKAQSCFNKEPQQILLSSPKPTTFQHYLVQPKDTKAYQQNLKHYASIPPTKTETGETIAGETVIRGHKLYWHKPSKIEVPENSDTQTSLIKPIDPDVEFTFKIYFENLSNIELGALLWVIDKAEQPEYCLSLGMGKPLGMGAIKLKIDKLSLDHRHTRYKQLFTNNNQWELGERLNTTTQKQDCINAFETYIFQYIHENEKEQASSFEEVRRIRMLLIMLQCNSLEYSKNPDYMSLDSYRKRRVLPNPLQVMGWEGSRRIDQLPSSPANSGSSIDPPKPKPKPKTKLQEPQGQSSNVEKPIKKDKQPQKPKENSEGGNSAAIARPPKPPKT
ncbi:TIGR03986 family type III CRISPR-associated RAMP protein [Anabaena azotica]|uniref:TIGR03986 family CRISPR-associated RAMP protein n=1 Tax=Anabaena azotica FACHB-119 TaxID=947527 RepID=A0ABR8CZJ1_9NOST|nr:TIGR03986 family CRISPR-associated RAMP protein [Anabaena azotica]MBD2499492.1 TIGR03986 family CRISPR-associated RAMP protein [Anabaena azotica FACHB-119]